MGEPLVVVTGGAGFIGSHLVARLAGAGARVRVIERPGARVDHLPGSVDVAVADIRDAEATRRALRGAGRVYHLAANPNLWARDPREFDRVNHRGTVHVLGPALEAGAGRVVHVSTESILTRAGATGTIGDDVAVELADAVGPYCRSKLRAERHAMALAEAGAPVVVVNPTMPVGPGDRGISPPTRLVRDFLAGRLPARMDCTLNVVDVRDLAEGIERAMDRARPGRRYLLGGENLTLVALLSILSGLTGVAVPSRVVPYPVGLAYAYASEAWAGLITGRPPRATVTGVRLTRRSMHFASTRAAEELGWSSRPAADSLAAAVDWLARGGNA